MFNDTYTHTFQRYRSVIPTIITSTCTMARPSKAYL